MISDKVLDLCEAHGGQLKAMAQNYRKAKPDSQHQQQIENHLLANLPMNIGIAYYQSINGKKGGSVSSEAKTEAARENGRRGGKPAHANPTPTALAKRRSRAKKTD